jgi:hypothetical protein
MDIDEDFQGVTEISTAEERNTADEDSATSVAFEAGEPQDERSSLITLVKVDESDEFEDSEMDLYLLNLTVEIAEIESEEIEEEFNDALVEIERVKSFLCEKVCKSKGGLTRHVNSKHGPAPAEQSWLLKSFPLDTVASKIEAIKSKITEGKLYGTEMSNGIKTATATKALYDALYPLFATFCRKKNQDKLVESFFALIPR